MADAEGVTEEFNLDRGGASPETQEARRGLLIVELLLQCESLEVVADLHEGLCAIDPDAFLLIDTVSSQMLVKDFCLEAVRDPGIQCFTAMIKGPIFNFLGYSYSKLDVMLSWSICLISGALHLLFYQILFVLFIGQDKLAALVEQSIGLHLCECQCNLNVAKLLFQLHLDATSQGLILVVLMPVKLNAQHVILRLLLLLDRLLYISGIFQRASRGCILIGGGTSISPLFEACPFRLLSLNHFLIKSIPTCPQI